MIAECIKAGDGKPSRQQPGLQCFLIAFILLFSACKTTYHGRDQFQKSIEDYNEELLSKPNSYQRYYQRAWLYSDAAYAERNEFEHCIADVEKAMSILTEEKSPFEYWQLRAYCRASIELKDGKYWNKESTVAGAYTKEEISAAAKPNILKAIQDYTTAIGLTPDPLDLVVLYESRAVLYFHLGEYKKSLKDFFIVNQFDKQINRRSTRHREVMHIERVADLERVWTMIRDNYEALVNEARQKNAPELGQLVASYETAKKHAAELSQHRRNASAAAYAEYRQQQEASRKEAEAERKRRLEQRLARSEPCGHCKGTGRVSTFEYGEARHCYGTTHNGSRATECTPTRPSVSGTGTCPICNGTGRVFLDDE